MLSFIIYCIRSYIASAIIYILSILFVPLNTDDSWVISLLYFILFLPLMLLIYYIQAVLLINSRFSNKHKGSSNKSILSALSPYFLILPTLVFIWLLSVAIEEASASLIVISINILAGAQVSWIQFTILHKQK